MKRRKPTRVIVVAVWPDGFEASVCDQEQTFSLAQARAVRDKARSMREYKGCKFKFVEPTALDDDTWTANF